MKRLIEIPYNPILAGFVIGVASICYLRSGSAVGMFLFAFGLATVVSFRWPLFTGLAGFNNNWLQLTFTLAMNVVGAVFASCLFSIYGSDVATMANTIVAVRIEYGFIGCLTNAIGCGFIMTCSVKYARRGNWWPLLLGVPTFIACGFPHCIADVGYYVTSTYSFSEYGLLWLASVIGNTIGCKAPTVLESNPERDINCRF